MPRYQQLEVLSRAGTTQQDQPGRYPAEQKVDQTHGHVPVSDPTS